MLLVPDLFQGHDQVPAMELVIDAYEFALIHALSVYDATYLALALCHGAGLITAD